MATQLDNDPLLIRIPLVEGWKVLAPVVLYAKIGQGGMGSVYRGRHLDFDIDVAVKCLKPSLAAEDEQFIARFRREAKLAAGLTHENLVRVYDYRRAHGIHYLVMEFVDGETARERVKRKGPLDELEAATIILGAARGLAKAHRNQETIVHRDVKPDNILISRRGEVKLADLGIAKAMEGDDGMTLSTSGVIGTPQYMAPEQWERDVALGPPADVWSFGVTLYFLLTGENAFRGGNEQQVYVDVCQKPFPDVRAKRPQVSAALSGILEKCVRKQVSERYPDAGALADALEGFVGRKSPSLVDSGTGSQRVEPLVSPPPMPTIRRIRTHVENKKGGAPAPSPELDGTLVMGRSNARWWWIGGGVAAAALAIVLGFIFLRGDKGKEETKSIASENPTHVETATPPVVVPEAPKHVTSTETPAAPAAPATIEILAPKTGPDGIDYVTEDSLRLTVAVGNSPATPLSAILNGKALKANLDGGKYQVSATLPPNKLSTIELACGATSKTFKAFYDAKDPVVTIESPPADGSPTNKKSVSIVARVVEDNLAGVKLGDTSMTDNGGGTWRADSVSLPKDGESTFKIVATDRAGRTGSATVRITRDTQAPELTKDSEPKDGSTVDADKPLQVRLVFNEPIATVVVDGHETRGTKNEAKLSVNVPAGSGSWELEGKAQDLAGNSGSFSISFRRKAKTSSSSPDEPFVRFDGFEVVGNERNALKYPRVIKHTATAIELLAVDFRDNSKPTLYVSSGLVNKRQFSAKGSVKDAQLDTSADSVTMWCLSRGLRLALPTKDEWQRMSKSSNPAISSPSTAFGELFQGQDSDTDWPIRTQQGKEGTQPHAISAPNLGFRVVFRVP